MNNDIPPTAAERLQKRRQILIDYLLERAEYQDWHGVSDAANDLRVLDETIRMTKAHP